VRPETLEGEAIDARPDTKQPSCHLPRVPRGTFGSEAAENVAEEIVDNPLFALEDLDSAMHPTKILCRPTLRHIATS